MEVYMMKNKALVVSVATGLTALCIPLVAFASPASSSVANDNSFVKPGSKVVYSASPITDLDTLRNRAMHGITDAPGKTVVSDIQKLSNTTQDLDTKVNTTVQKIKETDNLDGSKVTEYRQTSFITASTGGLNKTQTTPDPQTFSWESTVTMDYNEYDASTPNVVITYDQLLSGSAEWDTGGQTTGLPTLSNPVYTNAATGFTPSGPTFQQKDPTYLGTIQKYWVYTKTESWPYVDTAASKGAIITDSYATLTLNGQSWSWHSKAFIGNGQYCC
jgi:hypothetical protein